MKRMSLIPTELFESLMSERQLRSTTGEQLAELDDKRTDAMNSKQPTAIKAKLYNHINKQFANVRNNVLHAGSDEHSATGSESSGLSSDFTNNYPATYKAKARQLFAHAAKNLKFLPSGELIHEGHPIENSNYVDLISDLTRPHTRPPPPGADEFIEQLKQTNVPQSFIPNKSRWETREEQLRAVPVGSPKTVRAGRPPIPSKPISSRTRSRARERQKGGKLRWIM